MKLAPTRTDEVVYGTRRVPTIFKKSFRECPQNASWGIPCVLILPDLGDRRFIVHCKDGVDTLYE